MSIATSVHCQDFVPKPQISWCMELASRERCQWGIIQKPSLFANPHFNTVGLSINDLGSILLIINLIKPLISFKDFLEASVREYCLKHCLYPLFFPQEWGGGGNNFSLYATMKAKLYSIKTYGNLKTRMGKQGHHALVSVFTLATRNSASSHSPL